jgi:hypothetical protein
MKSRMLTAARITIRIGTLPGGLKLEAIARTIPPSNRTGST